MARLLLNKQAGRLLVVAALWAAVPPGCGRSGKDDGGHAPVPAPPDDNVDKDDEGFGLTTKVDLDPIEYKLGVLPSCVRRDEVTELPAAPADWVMDGAVDEWQLVQGNLSDPPGDALLGGDLLSGSVGRTPDGIALALTTDSVGPVKVRIELGGTLGRGGTMVRELQRTVTVWNGKVSLVEANGQAIDLPPEMASAAVRPGSVEVLLKRRLIGEVTSWPAWWVTLATVDSATGFVLDQAPAQYFPSLLAPDELAVEMAVCREWNGRKQPIDLVQVRGRGESATFGSKQGAESAFLLTRKAIDAVGGAWESPLPFAYWPVVALPLAIREPAESSPYDGTLLNADLFGPDAVEAFPQGPLIDVTTARILTLTLKSAFPEAQDDLVTAVARAIGDRLLREQVGDSFFFDFFGRDSGANPVVMGHILGIRAKSRHLVRAWKSLRSKWEAGETDLWAAYLDALSSETAADPGAGAGSAAWVGEFRRQWLDAAGDGEWGKSALADDDMDGLPNGFESAYGLDRHVSDTDGDGWSDLAEILGQTDPRASQSRPEVIMPDQLVADWQNLLPKRLLIDRTTSGRCPKAADIEFAAAIATENHLVIAGKAREFWELDPAAKWIADIDLVGSGKVFSVDAVSGSRELVVRAAGSGDPLRIMRRAPPVATRSVEFAINRRALAVDLPYNGPDQVKVRLRTVYRDGDGRDLYCDETPWFGPLTHN